MTIKNIFKPKRYNFFVKLIAVGIFGFMLFMLLGAVILSSQAGNHSMYDSYYEWVIIDDTVEKLDDGTYNVTLNLKNQSAYQCYIDKYSIRFEYGNNGTLENINPPYPDSPMYDTLNNVLLPAGQTIKYSLKLAPPEGVHTIHARYWGESYELSEAKDKDRNYSTYIIELK